MAYLTTGATRAPIFLAVLRPLAELFAGLQQGLRFHREFERLNALTDAQLSDRGLTRQDIVRHAFQLTSA